MDSLEQLLERIESLERQLSLGDGNTFKPTPYEYEREVPLVKNLSNAATTANPGSTAVVLTWEVPDDDRIEAFEIWSKNLTEDNPQWVMKGSVTAPPWGDNLVSDADKTVSFAVRTKLRNGLGTTIENSPTVPVTVTAPSDEITSPSQVGPNVIGDSAFVRTGSDKISITNADVVSLAATKITAGTLAAGVIYANAIAASQIQAGTISVALTLTSPTIISTSGGKSVTISSGQLISTDGSKYARVDEDEFICGNSISGVSTRLNDSGLAFPGIVSNTTVYGSASITLGSGGITNVTVSGSTGDFSTNGNVSFVGNLRKWNGSSYVSLINSSGAFIGPGVDVGSSGVGCGGVNISGGHIGQTVTFNSFPTQMVFRGGVLTGYTP